MSNASSRSGGTSFFTALIVGTAVGGTLYHLLKKDCPEEPDDRRLTVLACYDLPDMQEMLVSRDAAGVRFYLAKKPDGTLSVAAGPVKADSTHLPGPSGAIELQLFEQLSGSNADQILVDEARAETLIKAASTTAKPGWSMDAKPDVLNRMLRSGCNGIGVIERMTTDGSWTFDLVPVTIANDVATQHGTMADMAVGVAPCPNFCGRDQRIYLHTR